MPTSNPNHSPTRLPGSLMAAEKVARERDRLNFLQELHAARTLGVEREAAILLEHGRVILPQEVALDRNCSDFHDSTTANCGGGQGRWVSHVCRELRRNRFAAQRGAMRRNVVPALPPRLTTVVGREATGERASLSPPPTAAGSLHSRTGTTKTTSRKYLRSPMSAKGVRVSGGRRKRRVEFLLLLRVRVGGGIYRWEFDRLAQAVKRSATTFHGASLYGR